jgi:hypothetical protein
MFSDITKVDWRKWLDITTIEEYYETILKNSGLSDLKDFQKRIHNIKTNSRDFSIDLKNYITNYTRGEPLIICHTSGTTNSDLSAIKRFHIKNDVIEKVWAPGMQAIFESSGLTNNGSVVIFVPSRMKFDGMQQHKGKKYFSLYSSEFSQRIMISIINPKSYLLYPYKDVYNLDVLLKILKLDDIKAISAPAATILKWANLDTFKKGIENYLQNRKKISKQGGLTLNLLEKLGLDAIAKEMQSLLSKKLEDSTLIFSTSSLNEEKWEKIREFMNWEKGKEKFTNLYVGSEIGPFAASISKNKDNEPSKEEMFIFPLVYPMIEKGGKFLKIEEAEKTLGHLLVSRMDNGKALLNITSGDVIEVINTEGLPKIGGTIIRDNFSLKYPVKITDEITISENRTVIVGDYFNFEGFEIHNAKELLNCLYKEFNLVSDSLLLMKNNGKSPNSWKFFIPVDLNTDREKEKKIIKIMSKCEVNKSFINALTQEQIGIEIINDDLVQFTASRDDILKKVREGTLTKGILKKWPLYVILPKN